MDEDFEFFKIDAVPDKPFDKNAIFEIIGVSKFLIVYDFSRNITLLGVVTSRAKEITQNIEMFIPGLRLSASGSSITGAQSTIHVYRRVEELDKQLFSDVFDIGVDTGNLTIVFEPLYMDEIKKGKSYVEGVLSKRESGQTRSFLSGVINKRANTSLHSENFNNSEENMFLTELLESINTSILRNGTAYNVYFMLNDTTGKVEEYIKSRFLVFSKSDGTRNGVRALPFGISTARNFLNFNGSYNISYTMTTLPGKSSGNLEIGTLMKNAALDTRKVISIEPSSLNLGTIITGLPGSGKTMEAMAMINGIISKSPETQVCIIAPTDEWKAFADANSLYHVKIYDNTTPINFFRCPELSNTEKFYEDLAMILSSAASAGPYKNPMEKCMLNAFRKIYSRTKNPDPVAVYNEIEESIIKFHAKRTNVGIKYTKHGENIRSALENLRAVLCRPEYSITNGIEIEAMLQKGVVFDLSNVSGSTRPYIYALILNQVYSIASLLDNNGDNKLRLVLCIEEAQIIFRDKEKDNAAVNDLKYRIQDFRKQGIGLILLAHNVNDIESSIRRLCQTKLYLKQASDVAEVAARDLVFTYATEEEAVQKLKHLDSRVAALNYVVKSGNEKLSQDTVFIRTKDYQLTQGVATGALAEYLTRRKIKTAKPISSSIMMEAVLSESSSQKEIILNMNRIRLIFLGEEVADALISDGKLPTFEGLLQGKEYLLQILDRKGRMLYSIRKIAEKEIKISI
jgi:hypothetical protein